MIIFHPQFMNMTVLFTENEKKNDILFKKECYMLLNERRKQKTKKKSLKINFKFINWKKINRFSYYVSKTLDKFCCFRRFINEFFSCPFFNFIFVCDWNHRFCIFVEYAMSLQDSIGMYILDSVSFHFTTQWNTLVQSTEIHTAKFYVDTIEWRTPYSIAFNITDDTMSLLPLLREAMYTSDIYINPSTISMLCRCRRCKIYNLNIHLQVMRIWNSMHTRLYIST